MTRTTISVLLTYSISIFLTSCRVHGAFVPSLSNSITKPTLFRTKTYHTTTTTSTTTPPPATALVVRNLFDGLSKVFEESNSLGKGITVGKVQVSLTTTDRSKSSIMGILAETARTTGNNSPSLAKLSEDVCLALLRRSDEWVGACSESKWFSGKEGAIAESQFNDWSNREAAKFEKVRSGCGHFCFVVCS